MEPVGPTSAGSLGVVRCLARYACTRPLRRTRTDWIVTGSDQRREDRRGWRVDAAGHRLPEPRASVQVIVENGCVRADMQ
ncbi:hypothetical protein BCONGLO52_09110 [Brachybacterium conglomeratum]|uniref:Uncharacterized protein n=1 Tax=Brachybacterium conglomeratum TaxID=47846 RepID=A0ABQ5RGV3_9MICO|nr:hypothetical protein BCONGLO52_09110 [Brachybacterium conglomeratum]GLK04608.1 hypothetical protein GCM10017597_14080 [Brachybacterium conglomeratum]